MNPLSRVLAGLLGVLALVGAFFFGLVVVALAVGLGLLAWLTLALRLWWLRRQQPGARGDEVLDADYEVISRREDP